MPETDDDLETMTWEMAGAAFETADGAVLPLGSTEQHSTHLPLSVDSLRADHLTAALVEAAPDYDLRFVRLPTLRYGYSEHHMNYPGTVTLSAETYTRVLVEIGQSLAAHGVERLLMVNFHGGNREPMKLATDRIQRDHDLSVYAFDWTSFANDALEAAFGDDWGHAGDHETSVIELYRDDLVRTDEKEPQETIDFPDAASYTYFDDVTEQGGLGDPTNSDPDVMAEIVSEATGSILETVREEIDAGW